MASQCVAKRGTRGRTLCVIALAVALVGCAGVQIDSGTGPDDGASGTSGRAGGSSGASTTPAAGAALVGRWAHLLYFDYGGAVRTSETTWTFDAQGVATRLLVVRNLTDGYSDAAVAQGRWSADGRTIAITYTAPDTGTVHFAYRVESGSLGTTLYLDAIPFVKISQ